MQLVRTCLAVLVLMLLQTDASGEIRVESDRFTQEIIVERICETPELDGRPRICFKFSYSPTDPQPLKNGTLLTFFFAASSDWRFLSCHSVNVLADGQPLPVGDAKHEGKIQAADLLHELVALPDIGPELFKVMAEARFVHVRICTTEITLTPDMPDIRKFAQMLELIAAKAETRQNPK